MSVLLLLRRAVSPGTPVGTGYHSAETFTIGTVKSTATLGTVRSTQTLGTVRLTLTIGTQRSTFSVRR